MEEVYFIKFAIMRKIGLFSLFNLLAFVAFASFPVENSEMLADPNSEKFKLDTVAFIIGILTFWMMFLFGLPLLLLFINKKNFRGALALCWLAGLILPYLIVLIISAASFLILDFSFAY